MTITVTPSNPTKVEAISDTTTTFNPNTFLYDFADSIVGQIDTGVTVTGVGLEFESSLPNSATTTTTISVTNDGTVTAQSDSNAAIVIAPDPFATGDFGTFTYLGTGSVTNTGNGGALRVDNQGTASGTGNVDITISGTSTINGASTGDGIVAGTTGGGGTVKVTVDSGGLVEGQGAVELGGNSTVDNSGTITGISAGIQSATSPINLDNKLGGMITATGTNQSAIIAGESPVQGGSFSGSNEGTITSQGAAITSAGNVTITSNSGTISSTSTAVNIGNAVFSNKDVKVTANTGTISGGYTAIEAGGNADVTNSKTISGGAGFGITASGSVTLVNNQNATVSGDAGAVNAGSNANATVTNSGTLSSATGDTVAAASGTAKVTNNATGTITSNGAQVFAIAGNIVDLTNSGMVQAKGGSGSIAVFSADAGPISVTNSGTIQVIGPTAAGTIGGSTAIRSTASTGTNIIGNSGTISSNGDSGFGVVVASALTLTNSPDKGSPALIQATGAGSVGILASGSGMSGAVGITNDGTISGDGNAINTNTTGLTTITNTGTISNTTGGGATPGDIRVNVASITNMGTGNIDGADFGILFRNSQTTGSTIFNAGTISGTTAAIQFSSASSLNTLTLAPGFTITGNVTQGASNILQLGGSSGAGAFNVNNIGTQYKNFTTFNKVDTSTWTLTGTGAQAWTVEQGTLQVDGTIGNTTVQSGGTLDGTGTTGAATVQSGGTLAPGDDPGTITTGDLDLQSGSTLSIEIEGTSPGVGGFSDVVVNGSVTLAGTLSTTFLNGFTPQSGSSFEIINNDGNDAVSGIFAGLGEGAHFTAGSATYSITYKGGDGNDVVLTVTGSFAATLSSNSPVQGTPISVATANDNGTDVLGTATFQWKVNTGAGFVNATGTGATTATYTPTEGDEGGKLEVVVTNPADSLTTTATAINAVADSADLTATFSTNSPVQGSPISLTTVTDSGNDVHATATYQWMVNTGSGFVNATGAGATTATYTPVEGDEGGTLEVVITLASDSGNPSSTETTTVAASNTVVDTADLTATLSSNSPVQGAQISVATASDGNTNVLGTASYQWMVNTGSGFVNATGTGATTATYTPAEADEAGTLEVVVSVTDPGASGGTESTTVVASNTVAEIADLTATLSSNSPVQDTPISVATATDGGTNVLGTASYQWKVNTGLGFLNATGTGATTATYTPVEADEAGMLEVVVSFADPGGTETTTVTATNTIADSADLTATFSTNSPVQGSPISLTTVSDGGTDAKAGAIFQWKVNTGAGFGNATGTGNATATYTPTEGDEGGTLEVVISITGDLGNIGTIETTTVTVANAVADSADLTATLSSNSPQQGTPISVATVTDNGTDVKATATYQWMVNTGSSFVNATGTGATTAAYTPIEADEGGQLEVVVSVTDPGASGGVETTTVVASNTVADSADLTATLSSNSPQQGTPISVATASDGGTNVLGTASYQWKVNTGLGFLNATGTGATTATYTPVEADEAGMLEVVVSLTDPGNAGNIETTTVTATNTIADSADLTATFSTNSPVQGTQISVATATDGGTSVLNTATYQWMVNTGSGFASATGPGAATATYTPIEADEGGTLEVTIAISDLGNPGNFEMATMTVANAVADSVDLMATLSSNSPVQGLPIIVTAASDGGNDVLGTATYQWKVNTGAGFVNANGTGATTAAYTPTEADEGGTLEVVVSVTDPGASGGTETTTVVASNTVADSADLTATLSSNSPQQGAPISVMMATDGGTNVLGSASYQWKVNTGAGFVNATGTGATTATYTPAEADEGGTLEVVVSVTDPGNAGPTESKTVVAGNAVTDGADLVATLSTNSPVQGSAVTVTTVTDGGIDVSNVATFQWKVNTGAGFVNAIGSGNTSNVYAPIEQDEGDQLEVVVTLADHGNPGNIETTTVVAANAVADDGDLVAMLSGSNPAHGTPISVVLALDNSNNVFGTASYQWKVNTGSGFVNATGTGATTATYTPTEGDEGAQLEVVLSIADPGNPGGTESRTVTAGMVQESPTENATISLAGLTSGNAVEGQQITATVTELDAPASGINFTWKVNGTTVFTGTDAAGKTYTPTEANEGLPITVSVSFTDTHGNTESGTASGGTVQESPTENASFTIAGLVNGHVVPNNALTATVTEPDAPTNGITYTWKVGGTTKLTGLDAAAKTFTPQAGDAGKPVTLTVSFTDTHGFAETGTGPVGSAASAAPFDLNGDTISDLVFQNNGQPGVWLWNGSAPTAEVGLANPGASWHVITSRDVNGDGNADLIWQNTDGTPGVWLMNGTTPIAEVGLTNPGPSWQLVASGDTNGDGDSDLIWQNTDGTLGVWLMNGTTPTAQVGIGNPGSNWKVVGAADYSGDGNDDILLQDRNTGNLMIDLMNGTTISSTKTITVGDPSWHAVSTGEFNGQAEIAWQNNDGSVGLWLMNGTTPAAKAGLGNPGAGWQLISVDHFTPNGQADLLFQNNNTNAMMLWEMNGTSVAAMVNLPNPGAGWQSVNGHPFAVG